MKGSSSSDIPLPTWTTLLKQTMLTVKLFDWTHDAELFHRMISLIHELIHDTVILHMIIILVVILSATHITNGATQFLEEKWDTWTSTLGETVTYYSYV
jgi:hypothetical protein